MYCSVGLGTFSDERVWRHGGGWEGFLALERPSAAHPAGLATSLCDSTRRDVLRPSQAMRCDATLLGSLGIPAPAHGSLTAD